MATKHMVETKSGSHYVIMEEGLGGPWLIVFKGQYGKVINTLPAGGIPRRIEGFHNQIIQFTLDGDAWGQTSKVVKIIK